MPRRHHRLPRGFYRRGATEVAVDLLGRRLIRRIDGEELVARIVEVEAYLGIEDKAAHSYGGRHTQRNASMWMDGGTAYVYFVYGMHWCFNVVTETEDAPSAVLIRAVEPLSGLDTMRRLRQRKRPSAQLRIEDLCSGPAKLAQAFAIDRQCDGIDLTQSPNLFIEEGSPIAPDAVVASPRIGVDYALEWAGKPLRFTEKESRYQSRSRTSAAPRRRK